MSKPSTKIFEKILTKNNNDYKFIIENNKKEIIITCEEYKTKYTISNLKIKTNNIFNNIDKAYESIIQALKNNKVFIKEIFANKYIKLELNINVKIKEIKILEIILLYNQEKNNYKDLNINPINIEIIQNIQEKPRSVFNGKFIIFKSIDNLFYLICSIDENIEIYDIIDNIKTLEIKKPHKGETIYDALDHCFDEKNFIDLLLSYSKKNIKIWNINELECILNINTEKDIEYAFF